MPKLYKVQVADLQGLNEKILDVPYHVVVALQAMGWKVHYLRDLEQANGEHGK